MEIPTSMHRKRNGIELVQALHGAVGAVRNPVVIEIAEQEHLLSGVLRGVTLDGRHVLHDGVALEDRLVGLDCVFKSGKVLLVIDDDADGYVAEGLGLRERPVKGDELLMVPDHDFHQVLQVRRLYSLRSPALHTPLSPQVHVRLLAIHALFLC